MDNLIKKLQDEAGLTENQAVKALSIIKDSMDEGGMDVDWEKFFKGKYGEFKDKAKDAYGSAYKQTESYTNKLSDKLENFASKARKEAHELSKKAADFFDDKDEKKDEKKG